MVASAHAWKWANVTGRERPVIALRPMLCLGQPTQQSSGGEQRLRALNLRSVRGRHAAAAVTSLRRIATTRYDHRRQSQRNGLNVERHARSLKRLGHQKRSSLAADRAIESLGRPRASCPAVPPSRAFLPAVHPGTIGVLTGRAHKGIVTDMADAPVG